MIMETELTVEQKLILIGLEPINNGSKVMSFVLYPNKLLSFQLFHIRNVLSELNVKSSVSTFYDGKQLDCVILSTDLKRNMYNRFIK